jgi:hypothetical protein
MCSAGRFTGRCLGIFVTVGYAVVLLIITILFIITILEDRRGRVICALGVAGADGVVAPQNVIAALPPGSRSDCQTSTV